MNCFRNYTLISFTYFYNLYERRGLFFYRVNSNVISYVMHPFSQANYGVVETFLHYSKK